MKPCTVRRLLLGSLLSLACWPLALIAANPRDELLRLVPEDAAFCFVLQDLRGHGEALKKSPFLEQVAKSPLGMAVHAAPELKQLLDFETKLARSLKLDFAKLRDEVFGDALVFSYRLGPPDNPKQEQDLLLIRARDPKVLADFLERVNQVQKESGDLKETEVREHGGRKYLRRVERTQENYSYLQGHLLVVSSREEAIQQVIDRESKATRDEPPLTRKLRSLGMDKSLAVVWINPAAFEPAVAARVAEAKPDQVPAMKALHQYWKALDGAALAVTLGKNLEVSLAVQARIEDLPSGVKRLLGEAAKPSNLWERFPDDALLAMAGRVDVAALLDILGEFLTNVDRQKLHDDLERTLGAALGQSAIKDILPSIGPDWGLCVLAPPTGDKAWFPHVVAAVRVAHGQKMPPVDRALLSALDSYALLAVLDHNAKHKDPLSLKTVMVDKTEVKCLVNDQLFPPGLRPSYALHGGCLLLASSPDAIKRFLAVQPSKRPAGEEFPLFRLSVKQLRRFLEEHREPLNRAVAEKNQIPSEQASARLEGLLAGLQLIDQVELLQRTGQGQTTLTLRMHPVLPLVP